MVSSFNFTLLTLFLLLIVVIGAKPSLELSNNIDEDTSSKYQQLYELYKAMRLNPSLASVSNADLVYYIYQNFMRSNNEEINFKRQLYSNQQHH